MIIVLPIIDGVATEPEAEALPVAARRDRRAELISLLERSSSHWGYEDPIYRFYHQSFKVYGLQNQTSAIVRVLESLASARPLNPAIAPVSPHLAPDSTTMASSSEECQASSRILIEAIAR